jgi:hypothetical protein
MVANAVDGWSFSRFGLAREEEAGACQFVNTFQHHAATPTVIINTHTLLQVTPSSNILASFCVCRAFA